MALGDDVAVAGEDLGDTPPTGCWTTWRLPWTSTVPVAMTAPPIRAITPQPPRPRTSSASVA